MLSGDNVDKDDLQDELDASVAFCKIELSPDSIEIDIPANIKRTIIVITKAIKVIPLLAFKFFLYKFFISISPPPT